MKLEEIKNQSQRIADSSAIVPSLSKQTVRDLREKPIWPVRMSAIA